MAKNILNILILVAILKGAFDEFAGFYRLGAKKQAGRTRLFFGIQAVYESIERTLSSEYEGMMTGYVFCMCAFPYTVLRESGKNFLLP